MVRAAAVMMRHPTDMQGAISSHIHIPLISRIPLQITHHTSLRLGRKYRSANK